MPSVEPLSVESLEAFVSSNKVVIGYPHRPKMIETSTGEQAKCFYPKDKLSAAKFFPKAEHFAANGEKLFHLGFVGPRAKKLYYCEAKQMWMLIYERLPGKDLRALGNNAHERVKGLPEYMALLHSKGVYFRGIHLGNILSQEDSRYALIDISGMTVWPWPLSIWQRLRNVGRFVSFPDDIQFFRDYGAERFCEEYCLAAGLRGWRKRWLVSSVVARFQEAAKAR